MNQKKRKFHKIQAYSFPPVDVPLVVKTKDKKQHIAIRTDWCSSYSQPPKFKLLNNQHITLNEVIAWAVI